MHPGDHLAAARVGEGQRSAAGVPDVRGEHGSEHGRPDRAAERAEEAGHGHREPELAAIHAVLDRDDQHLADHAEAEAEQQRAPTPVVTRDGCSTTAASVISATEIITSPTTGKTL